MRSLRSEDGFVVSSVLKTLAVIAIFGIALFDAGSIAINFFRLDSKAHDIAEQVSNTVSPGRQPNVDALSKQAKQIAKAAGARLVELQFDAERRIVHVTLERSADTILVGKVGATEDWAHATADGQAPAPK